ncbi:probable chitinase 10 [Ochlerotatus camptorhynchus]|uniref:probable chitinase 10 n=1 Tax=Ochlerotatus camptorhynchus TaxID=644619 RepID=UPI0031DFF2E2
MMLLHPHSENWYPTAIYIMLALIITLSLVSGGFASILCPAAFNPNQTIHLSHPTSCSKFLTCVGSHPVEQDCPAGLHWNVEQSRCDYPESPQCSRGSDPDQPFNAAAVASSVCLPQSYQCPLNSKPTEHVIFLKHRDCRKFYACVSTHPVELSCPPKLYWNSRSCVCDYEMEAECDEMMVRVEEDAPEETDEEEHSKQEEDAPEEAEEEEHPIQEEDAPEEADQEQAEPEVNAYAVESVVVRKRRAADSSSSSSNDTSTSSGSGSSGSTIASGADIRSVSSIVMVVATVIMSVL